MSQSRDRLEARKIEALRRGDVDWTGTFAGSRDGSGGGGGSA